jgi:predicted porin
LEFVMKKSLIALAVLAASGASFAQSSVTLYGIADAWFGSVKVGDTRNTVVESGGVASSRFGFKGSEDLGGGLKANFLLEQGFSIDSGSTTSGQAFSRQAYVGLSGGFGEVKLGKMWTAYDDIAGDYKTVFNSDALSPINVWASQSYAANPNNGVYYATPAMGGFSAAVSYALGEDKNAVVAGSASSTAGFNVKYAGGPVSAALAYQTEEPQGGGASTDFTTLRGSYDLGVVKLVAGAGRKSGPVVGVLGEGKSTDWLVGVDFPVSSALTLSAGYARSTDKDAYGDDKRKGLGLAAAYSVSKRTTLYTGVTAQRTTLGNGVNDNAAKVTAYAVGVNHAF